MASPGALLALVSLVILAGCAGASNVGITAVPPDLSDSGSHAMKPQFAYKCPPSGCDPGSNDGNLGGAGSITNPGPLPNEGGCNPSIETDCSVAVAPKYRSPQERACNDKGGVFITKQDGTTVCSAGQILNSFIGYDVGCPYVISTYPVLGGGTGIKIVPKPSLIPTLPSTYDSVYGVRINADCGYNIVPRNANAG